MKSRIILMVLIVIVFVSLQVFAGADEINDKIDKQIEEYTKNIETLESSIQQGIVKLDEWKLTHQQLIGGRFSLRELKKELLAVNEKEVVGEVSGQADIAEEGK